MQKSMLIVFLSIVFLSATLLCSHAKAEMPARWLPANQPDWVNVKSRKVGDKWQFAGVCHDVSVLDVGIVIARADALSNLASSIGVRVSSSVQHRVMGSEAKGYSRDVSITEGYETDSVAYGVVMRDVWEEEFYEPVSGKLRYNVHVLLEMNSTDLGFAREDYEARVGNGM